MMPYIYTCDADHAVQVRSVAASLLNHIYSMFKPQQSKTQHSKQLGSMQRQPRLLGEPQPAHWAAVLPPSVATGITNKSHPRRHFNQHTELRRVELLTSEPEHKGDNTSLCMHYR